MLEKTNTKRQITGTSNCKADVNDYSTLINHRFGCCSFKILFGKAIEMYLKHQPSGTIFSYTA